MALELAESVVRVNCVCPASVDTPLLRQSFLRSHDPEAASERNRKRHPLGRFRTPEDVADLVLFLAADEATWITGGTYVIDGASPGVGRTRAHVRLARRYIPGHAGGKRTDCMFSSRDNMDRPPSAIPLLSGDQGRQRQMRNHRDGAFL